MVMDEGLFQCDLRVTSLFNDVTVDYFNLPTLKLMAREATQTKRAEKKRQKVANFPPDLTSSWTLGPVEKINIF